MKKRILVYCLAAVVCVCFAACNYGNPIIETWWKEQNQENSNINDNAIPVIITHPKSAAYLVGAQAEDLTVTASCSNGTPLSYQWYKNDTDNNMGGNLIPGATEKNYNPCTDYKGITYYYVVVTNLIDNNGSGSIKANAISNTAEIEVDRIFAAVAITGLSVQDKIYDGTTAATLIGTPVLNGVIPGHDVTLITGTVKFADASAALNKGVIFSGWSLAGADADKYWLQMPNLTANITTGAAAITVTITGLSAQNKTYDGTTTATVTGTPMLHGVTSGHDVTLITGIVAFADKNSANNKAVIFSGWSLAGADADKYILQIPGLTANITRKPFSITGLSVKDKVFDGTTAAAIIGTPVLTGVLSGDDVSIIYNPSRFVDEYAGDNKSVIFGGYAVGADAHNYILVMPNLTGNILSNIVTLNSFSVQNKTYDGTTTATLIGTPVLNGVIPGDDVTLITGTADFEDKNAEKNKAVIFSGWSLSGADAYKYTLQMPGLTGTISRKMFTVSGLSIQDKTYDGTRDATAIGTPVLNGVLPGDIVHLAISSYTFVTAEVGDNKDVFFLGYYTGLDDLNYMMPTPDLKGNIKPAGATAVTITGLSAQDKTYDGTPAAAVTGTPVLGGVIPGDDVSLITFTAEFADAYAGLNKSVVFTSWLLGGADAGKYRLQMPSLKANITASAAAITVTVTGLSAQDKTYDGTTMAAVTGTPVLNGVIAGDDVTLVTGNANFTDINAADVKDVVFRGWALGGADAHKYILQMPGLTAKLIRKNLTVTGLSVQTKIYDGTRDATIVGTPVLNGVLPGDDVILALDSLWFGSTLVAFSQPIVFGGRCIGADMHNYVLVPPDLRGRILQADSVVIWPSGLTAAAGQTLKDIPLPGNGTSVPNGTFSWTSPGDSVGGIGTRSHNMTFTPRSTQNYTTITQDVYVTVK